MRTAMARGATVALALLALLVPAEARRKRERRPRKPRDGDPAQVEPRPDPGCRPAGCEPGVRLLIDDEGPPQRSASAFRYRLRIGEQKLEGACPPGKSEAPLARCVPGGLLVPLSPERLDVVIEGQGLRPLLQTLSPSYEDPRCCPHAELRLLLRRERE